ncbi:MAG: gamma-glutamyltransferase [Saprospiraceae bacterium]|nr:gamma-glutamyltransferase [Saprospiraceae bacterium]
MRKKIKGTIAAGHQRTAEVGALIFEEGGNAFDAAIAAFFASCVAEPCMSSLGGGGFALTLDQHGTCKLFDFFCQTPKYKRPINEVEFYPMTIDFGETSEIFHIGKGAMGVPGILSGLFAIHKAYGTIPMTELVIPAVEMAKKGVAITDFQFFDIRVLRDALTTTTEIQELFYPNNQPIAVGEIMKLPKMADYLDYVVREGHRDFYEGEVAQQIVRDCQEKGGFLTLEDFREYQTIVREPLFCHYRDHLIATNPLPSVGGTLIGLFFKELAKQTINYDAFSVDHTQNLQHILEDLYKIKRVPEELTQKWGSTTHFNVADELGNALSITMSNGEGSGYLIPNTQIIMNNMLGESALLPNGFHSWLPNTRLSSMMSPTLVMDKMHNFQLALGTGGASRIPGAIAQVLHYILDLGLGIEEAVHAARMHNEHNELNLEPDFVGKHLSKADLNVINWDRLGMFFGGVHTIAKQAGRLIGAGDTRREGVAIEVL